MEHLTDLQIAAMVDNGLSLTERQNVTQHLSYCTLCTARVTETQLLLQIVDNVWLRVTNLIKRLVLPLSIAVKPYQATGDISSLPSTLQFRHLSSGVMSSPNDVISVNINVPSSDDQLRFILTWTPNQLCQTDVSLEVQGEEVDGATLRLLDQEGRMLERCRLDDKGKAKFERLAPSNQYLLQVRYKDEIWELPFVLTALKRMAE